MDDWLRIKPWFEWRDDRVDPEAARAAARRREQGALVVAWIPGGFDLPRQLMGEENVCLAFYEQPELIHDILATVGDTAVKALERVTPLVTIDQLSVHEDMAGKSGPLVGPEHIAGFIAPYYRRCWDVVRSAGGRLFQQDSDGNMNPVVDAFLDAGLTNMFPMEPAAGMDIVALRRRYGRRLAMSGGIDKHVLRQSKDAILHELEYKMQPALREGGMVFGLDHRIPNGTPIELYRFYVDKGREILGLPPRSASPSRGWRRMAF
jgi:uroporphyrinogen-III decarboxylase